jgi:hypothetical protein
VTSRAVGFDGIRLPTRDGLVRLRRIAARAVIHFEGLKNIRNCGYMKAHNFLHKRFDLRWATSRRQHNSSSLRISECFTHCAVDPSYDFAANYCVGRFFSIL